MNSISWKHTEKLLKRSKVNIYPLIKNRPDNNCLTPFHPRHCTGPQLKTKPKSTISLAPTSCSSVRLTLRNTTQDIHDFQEVLTVSRNLPENVFRGRRKLRELRSGNAYLSSSARAYIAWWEWPGGVEGGGGAVRTRAGGWTATLRSVRSWLKWPFLLWFGCAVCRSRKVYCLAF